MPETQNLTDPARAVLTTAQKQAYIAATKCLMDPKKAPSKTKYAGSRTRWEELQVTHVAQVQFIHGVVSLPERFGRP